MRYKNFDNDDYNDDNEEEKEYEEKARRKKILTIVLGVITVILFAVVVKKIVRKNTKIEDSPVVNDAGITAEPTEEPEDLDESDEDEYEEYKTEYGTYEFLTDTDKERVEAVVQRVANIRYNGEYTDEDYEYILQNFDEESVEMIDSTMSNIPDGKLADSNGYVEVTQWVEDTDNKIKIAKQQVEDYPYKTYSDYLHGEFPDMYSDEGIDDSEGNGVDGEVRVPNWCMTIFVDFDNGTTKWTGCSPQDAKESGILDDYLNEIYPAIYGEEISEEDKAFDYDAYEKGSMTSIEEESKEANRQPLTEEEWKETYKTVDIPKYIYTSDCVVKDGKKYKVYYSSFGSADSIDIKINGYEYTVYKETEEPGWATCSGNELFNFEAHISSQSTPSIDGAITDIQVSLSYSGHDGTGNRIEDSVPLDIALMSDNLIHLYYIGDLSRCSN